MRDFPQPTKGDELSTWLCARNGVNIDETTVGNLLKKAKAPDITPEALTTLTKALVKAAARVAVRRRRCEFEKTQLEDEKKRRVAQISPVRSEFERAQAAIDELRCAVPKITSRLRRIAGNDPNISHYFERADAIDAWLTSAPDFVAKPPRRSKWWWADTAKFIFLHYQKATGVETLSREGPAVRFVNLALIACGAEWVSKAVIEKAITKKNS
jgi:hypothetical protein